MVGKGAAFISIATAHESDGEEVVDGGGEIHEEDEFVGEPEATTASTGATVDAADIGKTIQVMVRVRPLIGTEKGQHVAWKKQGQSLCELDESTGELKKDSVFPFQV